MPDIITSEKLLEQAQVYVIKASEILRDVENLDAEKRERADNLRKSAEDLIIQSDMLANIKEKQNFLPQPQDDRNIDKNKDPDQDRLHGYKSMGFWLKSVWSLKANRTVAGPPLRYWDGEGDGSPNIQKIDGIKALAESVGATGGILTPAEFTNRILTIAENETIVRPKARVIRMNRRQITLPALDQTSTVAGGFSWFGGVVTYYLEEAGAMTASNFTFRDVTLTAHNLTAYTISSNQLLDDSAVSLEDFVMTQLPRALAYQADYDYLQGDGVGKPLGIINSNATITVARKATNTVTYDDLVNMYEKALPSAGSMWVASQSVLSKLLTMNGPDGNPSYLWGSAMQGVPATLLGLPIMFTDKLPRVGTAGDIILVDLSYYLVGDRQAVTMDTSTEEYFKTNQTSWRAIMRHDGRPWLSAPITYRDGQTTVSPFVMLGDKAT